MSSGHISNWWEANQIRSKFVLISTPPPSSSKNRKSKFICITLPSLRIAGWEVNIVHFRTSGRLGWVAQKESSRPNNEFSWKGQVSTNEGGWERGGDIYIIRMIYIANWSFLGKQLVLSPSPTRFGTKMNNREEAFSSELGPQSWGEWRRPEETHCYSE